MQRLPSVFVSHGAPTLVLEDVPARAFLARLCAGLPRPNAIVVVSAHNIGRGVEVSGAKRYHAVHDFHGFPEELYRLRYAPPGDPELAARIVTQLVDAGVPASLVDQPGLDHGAWVPLMLAFPQADVPVVAVSLDATMREAGHIAAGRALAPLREQGVLLLASGSFTHNLREFGRHLQEAPAEPYVEAFSDWMAQRLAAHDNAALEAWKREAPHAMRAHPTAEHLMPLFVAYGAGSPDGRVARLHHSVEYGVLAMDAFAFH